MSYNLGLDIGAHTARMAVDGRGVIYHQSAAVAIARKTSTPIAFGDAALKYKNRTSGLIDVRVPFHSGLVADDTALKRLYEYLFETALNAGFLTRPRVLLAVDGSVLPVPVRHMVALAMDAGALSCAAVRSDFMAALGAGININRPEATLVMDIGASRISSALISGGRLVHAESLPFGMARLNETISRSIRLRHGLVLSEQTAEEIKLQLCSAASGKNGLTMAVTGFKPQTGFPTMITITDEEVIDAATLLVESICEMAASMVDHAPVELAADLNDTGITLTGGGAQLFGLDKLVADKTGMICRVTENASNCIARGLLLAMDKPEQFQTLFEAGTRRIERKLPGARGAT